MFGSAYNSRGYAYMKKRNYNLAIADFDKALEIDSNSGKYRHNRLEAYYYSGEYSKAWEDVHEKWCKPLWQSFARKIGVEVEVIPGEICCVKLKK